MVPSNDGVEQSAASRPRNEAALSRTATSLFPHRSYWPRSRSNALLEAKLPIYVSAMTHRRNVHQKFGIVDAVNDTPIADPNSPQTLCALELLATGGSWCCRECLDA